MSRLPIEVHEIPMTGTLVSRNLKINIAASLGDIKADLFVAALPAPSEKPGASEDAKKPLAELHISITGAMKEELTSLIARQKFSAGETKNVVVRLPAGSNFQEAGILGLGNGTNGQFSILDLYNAKKGSPISSLTGCKLGKALASMASSVKAGSVALLLETSQVPFDALQSLIEAFLMAQITDKRFKSKPDDSAQIMESLTLIVPGADMDKLNSTIARAKYVAAGIQLTKELVATPPNVCNPETLAKAAVDLAKEVNLECKVLGEKECVERKMGAFLAVNQGSIYAPQFIHMTYKPEGTVNKKLVLIGKGLTMDTGGLNLKLSAMESMKMDMGGSAAVLGAARIIGTVRPKGIEVHFIIAAAENAVDAKSYRPGDVITASNGKTIEVLNTDAEGRLTLADALVYGETEVKPDMMIDCATLTGAVIVGLGTDVAAAYSSDSAVMSAVLESARVAGSPIWPMPLYGDYASFNESKLADLRNLPTKREGGSITAALFLKEFVKTTPWCHIDLAGPAFDMTSREATGYGAKLLSQFAFHFANV